MYPTIQLATAILEARRARRARRASDNRNRSFLIAGLFVIVTVTACAQSSAAVPSPVTEEQAVQMAESALEGFNAGDYVLWSADWSPTMKQAIDEDAFLAFRDQFHSQLGDYVEIAEVTGSPGADAGTFRWTFDVEFENGAYQMWFGFKQGSTLIEGVSFEEPAA